MFRFAGTTFEATARSFFIRNKWKLPTRYAWQDGVHDAYLIFCKLRNKYSHVEEQKHFMALFMTSLNRHLFDIQKKKDRELCWANYAAARLQSVGGHDESMMESAYLAPDTTETGELAEIISKLPDQFQKAVQQLMNRKTKIGKESPEQKIKRLSRIFKIPANKVMSVLERIFIQGRIDVNQENENLICPDKSATYIPVAETNIPPVEEQPFLETFMQPLTSAIETELKNAFGPSFAPTQAGESRQDYLARLVVAGSNLDDNAFYALSEPASNWVNEGIETYRKWRNPQGGVDAALVQANPIADYENQQQPAEPQVRQRTRVEQPQAAGTNPAIQPPGTHPATQPAGTHPKPMEQPQTGTPAAPAGAEAPKRRGRPPKAANTENAAAPAPQAQPQAATSAPAAAPAQQQQQTEAPEDKSRRGRPVQKTVGGSSESLSVRARRAVLENSESTIEEIMEKLYQDGVELSHNTLAEIYYSTRWTLRLLVNLGWLNDKAKVPPQPE